jgi:hypothetical protein
MAAAGALVAVTLVSGCGQSAADHRAADVSNSAETVARDAGKYLDETWQEQAEREYWDRQQFYDSWDKITPRTAGSRCD